jgi:hypothetical protein
LSSDLADRAVEFIQDAHVNVPDKPFYLHYRKFEAEQKAPARPHHQHRDENMHHLSPTALMAFVAESQTEPDERDAGGSYPRATTTSIKVPADCEVLKP